MHIRVRADRRGQIVHDDGPRRGGAGGHHSADLQGPVPPHQADHQRGPQILGTFSFIVVIIVIVILYSLLLDLVTKRLKMKKFAT